MCSRTCATISAPKPLVRWSSCTTSNLPVLRTDSKDRFLVPRTNRAEVNHLDFISVFRALFAALKLQCTGVPRATIVASFPERRTRAFRKAPHSLYCNEASMRILDYIRTWAPEKKLIPCDRIQVLKRPAASSAKAGTTTRIPGK